MRRLLLLLLVSALPAFAQTEWHATIVDNLPTASTYSDTVSGLHGGAGGANLTDTLVASMVYSDSVSLVKGKGATPSDSLSHSDSASYTHGLNLPAEQLMYADQPSVTASGGAGHAGASADSLLVALVYSDSVTVAKNQGGVADAINPSDSFALSDTVVRGFAPSPVDSLALSTSLCMDTASSGLRESLSISDRVTVNAQTGGFANSRQITQTLTESDTGGRLAALNINPTESLVLQDFVGPSNNNPVALTDSFSLTSSVQGAFGTTSNREQFTFADHLTLLTAHKVRLGEQYIYTDGVRACSSSRGRCKHGLLMISQNREP